jgi:hypothetical protein
MSGALQLENRDPLRRASDKIAGRIAAAMAGQPSAEIVELKRSAGLAKR